jgi:DNA-binding LacI/PurR family transcriptional regulator
MATIKEVAERAGVSICTVSRYLNQTSPLKKKTEERVRTALRDVGYIPNTVAKSLRTHRTANVAVVLPRIDNLFYSEITSGISETLNFNRYNLFITEVEGGAQPEQVVLQRMLENMIAGVIFVGLSYDRSFQNSLRLLLEHGIAVVYVNRAIPYQGYPLVYTDYCQAGRLAAEHLCELGRKKLAVIGRIEHENAVLPHIQGFLDAANCGGADVPSEDVLQVSPRFPIRPEVIAHLANARVNGIFATNELTAVGLIKGLLGHGVRIPEQTAVIGLGNSIIGEIISPELTCVDLENHLTGVRSAEALLAQIAGKACENVTVLAPRLIKRNSA